MSMVALRQPLTVRCKDMPTPTQQQFKDACDINKILKRFTLGQGLPPMLAAPMFADVYDAGDFRTAVDRVRMTNDFFMRLPADVRSEFSNDAALFLDALADPNMRDRLIELKLFPKQPEAGSDGAAAGAAGTIVVGNGGTQ